jgi:protein SCO1/2
MKNKSYIPISFVILIFGIIFIPKIVKRIKNNDVVRADRLNRVVANGKKANLLTFEKVPTFSFTNQDLKTITNKDYENKIYVVEFFFTSCPTICPKMNENMVKIQKAFLNNPNFAIASISIDPERDTPEVLKKYAQNKGADLINWNFLRGEKETVYKLAKKGFQLYAGENKEAEGGFEHSGLFALIDKNGYIRSRVDDSNEFNNPLKFYDGLDTKQVKWLIEDITLLLKE